jgi:hypothetical protein
MKLATCALLVACSIVAVADEPQTAPASPAGEQAGHDNRVDQQKRDELIARKVAQLRGQPSMAAVRVPSDTCYFIRTIRPTQSEPPAAGFIKLQARLGPIEHGPDCTNIGALKPSIPVQGPDAGEAASDPVLTPVANR